MNPYESPQTPSPDPKTPRGWAVWQILLGCGIGLVIVLLFWLFTSVPMIR